MSFGAGGHRACNRPIEERGCDDDWLAVVDDDDPPAVRSRGDVGGGTPALLNRRRTGAMLFTQRQELPGEVKKVKVLQLLEM